jgi:hypothetical protein
LGKAINPEDFIHASSVWQMVQQSVPGITVEGNFFDPTVAFTRYTGMYALSNNSSSGLNADESTFTGGVMESNGIAYFLNGVNVSKDVINTISVQDLALIKVLKIEAAALGASEGALAFYTKKGVTLKKAIYEKAFTKIVRNGYHKERLYYIPDYDKMPDAKKTETDNRSTLYWNPKIVPSKNGGYNFSFYNSDLPTAYKLIIQGMDANGKLIHLEQIIK